MLFRTFAAGALAAMLIMPATALAQDRTPGAGAFLTFVFNWADADDDGALGPDEITALRMRGFDRADADGDGVVSSAEQAAVAERAQRRATQARLAGETRFDQFDADGDGSVTRAEYRNGPTPFFSLIDADGNGRIDRQELDRLADIVAELR